MASRGFFGGFLPRAKKACGFLLLLYVGLEGQTFDLGPPQYWLLHTCKGLLPSDVCAQKWDPPFFSFTRGLQQLLSFRMVAVASFRKQRRLQRFHDSAAKRKLSSKLFYFIFSLFQQITFCKRSNLRHNLIIIMLCLGRDPHPR